MRFMRLVGFAAGGLGRESELVQTIATGSFHDHHDRLMAGLRICADDDHGAVNALRGLSQGLA